MDKLTDFLDEVKIRLRNPLFASFILSWLVWNWKIWIGLFWLDAEALKRLEHSSYVDYVENELSMGNGFFNPFVSAVLIVLVLPIIRNLIEMYQAWALNWGERRVMNISKTGVISIEKYIEKKNQLETQHEEFKKRVMKESELIYRLDALEKEIDEKNLQVDRVSEANSKLRDGVMNSLKTDSIQGTWDVRPGFDGNEGMRISISGNDIYQLRFVDAREKYAEIIFCQNYNGRLTLCFKNNNMINFLSLDSNNRNYMTGKWNDGVKIEWERKR